MVKIEPSESPTFDFSKLSRRWEKEFRKVNMELVELSVLLEHDGRDNLTREEAALLMAEKSKAANRVLEIDEERERLVAAALVDVPRSWLVDDAPDDLDWHDPASLDWLQAGTFDRVIVALNEERSAKN